MKPVRWPSQTDSAQVPFSRRDQGAVRGRGEAYAKSKGRWRMIGGDFSRCMYGDEPLGIATMTRQRGTSGADVARSWTGKGGRGDAEHVGPRVLARHADHDCPHLRAGCRPLHSRSRRRNASPLVDTKKKAPLDAYGGFLPPALALRGDEGPPTRQTGKRPRLALD
jgi:hypothetical protein